MGEVHLVGGWGPLGWWVRSLGGGWGPLGWWVGSTWLVGGWWWGHLVGGWGPLGWWVRSLGWLVGAPFFFQDDEWAVIKSPPNSNAGHVTLGLLLDTDHAFSILDMGPSADSSEVNGRTSVEV